MSIGVEASDAYADVAPSTGPSTTLTSLAVASALTAAGLAGLRVPGAHACGYILGALVTSVLVALSRHRDVQRRSLSSYVPSPVVRRLALLALVVGIAAGGWHAFWLATEIAK